MATPNITQLLSPSLGNTAQDVSGGIAKCATGLAKEKERQRNAALDEALLRIREMEAQNRGIGKPQRPVLQPVENPDGTTTLTWFYPPEAASPGTPQPIDQQPVTSPTPRSVSTGKPGRTSPFLMYGASPTPTDEGAAQFAPAVAEGFAGVRDITNTNSVAAAEGEIG